MGRLTTHVLDTAQGIPGKGIKVNLYFKSDSSQVLLASKVTNDDGRCDTPLLEGDKFIAGEYLLEFEIGNYFKNSSLNLTEPHFLNNVLIQFYAANSESHYHVPLLVTPWSYSTYRGS
ncbi:hydroxyisourate hydrolase [Polynucleobacter kasalickyi]|uniref:5-hydroxyisourate hydrolase n=1 Tax=Polynucleobacter kasalickyi TaxID=1938817 RepID=A0A1W2BCA3_9BURK|nr:hydroxyisourate hydrolase [Polynucleobacter kasalickyi]SMC70536.1 5-hydroxyisourate hydrolase [Polynucleobacter kasalickyi]